MTDCQIDLNEVTGNGQVRNLAGKDRGISARAYYGLDRLDSQDGPVLVKVPASLYAMSSSFFLGLFSKSFKRFSNRETFLTHYRFDAASDMLDQINHGIDRALSEPPLGNKIGAK